MILHLRWAWVFYQVGLKSQRGLQARAGGAEPLILTTAGSSWQRFDSCHISGFVWSEWSYWTHPHWWHNWMPSDFGHLNVFVCGVNKLVTSMTYKNAWHKLGLTLNRTKSTLRSTSGTTIWDHVWVLVADTFEHNEWVSSFLTAHQHIIGYSVP